MTALTLPESKRLVALENVISAGQKTFVAVGVALAEIRDAKLYRADHDTFEDYCRSKWGWTKQHVYRLIECAPIAKSNPQVTSLNQAREVAKVPAERRAEVVTKAKAKADAEERPMRARDIIDVASENTEPLPKSSKQETTEALTNLAKAGDEKACDSICEGIIALRSDTTESILNRSQLDRIERELVVTLENIKALKKKAS